MRICLSDIRENIFMRSNFSLRLFIVFVMLFVMGIGSMISFGNDSKEMAKGMEDFNYMTESDFRKGMFVQGTIYELDGEFAYEEEYERTLGIKHNERVSAHYYAMPLISHLANDEEMYVAVMISNNEMSAVAERMCNETYDYWSTGYEPDQWTELDITGKVTPLTGELMDFFVEWMGEDDPAAAKAMICPYVINYYQPSGASTGSTAGGIMMAIGAAGLAVMITLYFKGRKSEEPIPETTSGFVPTQPAPFPEASAYKPVSSPAPQPAPEQKPAEEKPKYNYSADIGSMDDIDTSGLGIGIGDDD